MKYRYFNWSKPIGQYQFNFHIDLGEDSWVGSVNQYGLGVIFIPYKEHFLIHCHLCGIRLRISFEYFRELGK